MTRKTFRQRLPMFLAAGAVVGLLVGLRLIALDADIYPRLSWSSALLTDEGFYIHNARNRILFGTERLDEWNNALIMPVLHCVQLAVFGLFGVGAVQARLISVVFSLATLLVFGVALRRQFGAQVAALGTLFLGLDHVNLLYNRMALMDTPAAFFLALAFAAFLRAAEPKQPPGHVRAWMVGCGLALGFSYATRGLAALLLPIPLALLWTCWRHRRGERPFARNASLGLAIGLGGFAAAYILLWLLPNRAELARVNHYYLFDQLLPDSAARLLGNIQNGLFGGSRYLASYLARHTPVQTALALIVVCAWHRAARARLFSPEGDRAFGFLQGWLLLFWLGLLPVNYAPSRYYVLFYPPLAALAALATVHWRTTLRCLVEARFGCLGAVGLLAYHAGYLLSNRPVIGAWMAVLALGCGGYALFIVPSARRIQFGERVERIAWRGVSWTLAALWLVINLYWLGDWLTHLTYKQQAADLWLAQNLPSNSVLLGAVAPGLCLNNRLRVVNVIETLCNDDRPVERFAPAPRYILILDNAWKERYWAREYPQLVAPTRRIHAFEGILRPFFTIGVYPVRD